MKAAQEASDPSGNDDSSEEQPAETAAVVGLKRNSKRAAKADRLSAAETAKAKACGETLEKHVGRRSQGSVRFDEAEVLRDLASAQLKEAEEGGRASGGKGKKKKAKGLGTEAVTRAAERTLTAISRSSTPVLHRMMFGDKRGILLVGSQLHRPAASVASCCD